MTTAKKRQARRQAIVEKPKLSVQELFDAGHPVQLINMPPKVIEKFLEHAQRDRDVFLQWALRQILERRIDHTCILLLECFQKKDGTLVLDSRLARGYCQTLAIGLEGLPENWKEL